MVPRLCTQRDFVKDVVLHQTKGFMSFYLDSKSSSKKRLLSPLLRKSNLMTLMAQAVSIGMKTFVEECFFPLWIFSSDWSSGRRRVRTFGHILNGDIRARASEECKGVYPWTSRSILQKQD